MSDVVAFELSKDEALVLFEWLSRREEEARKSTHGGAQVDAEEIVLSGVLAVLEKSLAEPFDRNYASLLAAARRRVLGNAE